MNKKFYLLIIVICLFTALSGCNAVNDTTTPESVELPKDTQIDIETQENPNNVWVRQTDEMSMINTPGGTFQMGSTEAEVDDAIELCQQHYSICNRWFYERESPIHTVTLDEFWIDQTEVSNTQYRLCVEAGICVEPASCMKGEPTFNDLNKADYPVVCVNWEDAQDYCEWTGTRLPTEAEWEYAFRGESGSIFPWGNAFDGTRLNYCDQNCSQSHADDRFDDGYPLTAPTGSFPTGISWAGVYNMSGNVYEWVADWFGEYSDEAVTNPSGPITGDKRMLKGCSWFSHPTYCRGAARPSVDPDTRFDYLGFRRASNNPTSSSLTPESMQSQEHTEPTETLSSPDGILPMNLDPIVVPSGQAPNIDGTLSPGEWDDAVIGTFADGSQLFLLEAEDYLYLGIRNHEDQSFAGNVYIHHGEKINILHSSAALGTAAYEITEDGWQQIQDFTWQLRDTSSSEAAQAERATFLITEGWLASNGNMGTPNELEYQIKIQEQNLNIAVVFTKSTAPYEKVPWPAHLDDDTIMPTPGGFPTTMAFSPTRWGLIEFD